MFRSRRRSMTGALVAAVLALSGACHTSPSTPTPVCSYSLSPQQQSFTSEGGSGQVAIATDAACQWSISGVEPWITLQSPASGSGPATVRFTVVANAAESIREVTLTVASQPFRVHQEGRAACGFSISPDTQSFPHEGGSGQVTVSTAENCAWTAASNDSWISIAAGASGRGNGSVNYVVSRNTAETERTGTVTIAGRTFTVHEGGESGPAPECTYSVAPVSFAPCMPGGSVSTKITTEAKCTWTAAPGAGWLGVSAAGGSGPATITITFSDNYDAPREGAVMVRWPTPTAGQNVHVAQAGCVYGVSTTSMAFTAAGGSDTFNVVQESQPIECGGPLQDRCVWTAKSSASWVTITSSMPRTGDNPVAFTVAANAGPARSATITVRDKVVTVSQAGP